MSSNDSKRFPDLSELTIALLEHLVKPIIGDKAIEVIKSPIVEKELKSELQNALSSTETRFVYEHPDKDVCQAILHLPVSHLPSIQHAVSKFFAQPTSTDLEEALRKELWQSYPSLSERRVEAAVETYLRILREEISLVAPSFREKLVAIASIQTERNTSLALHDLEQIADSIEKILQPNAQVTLIIERDVQEFTLADRESLILSVSRTLNINPSQVRIVRVTLGSLLVTLELPKEAIELLITLLLKEDPAIAELRIVRVEFSTRVISTPADQSLTIGKQDSTQAMLRGHSSIKILFLAANPRDTSQLRLSEEIRSIDLALRQSEYRDRFEISQHWAVRVADLQEALLRYRPNVVHFSGHGSHYNEIIFEDEYGNSNPVPPRALGQLFAILKDNIKCVVLNACYSEPQAIAIAKHIDCVIGMSQAIGDRAAISFAASFYQGLGFGKSIKTAFDLGRVRIDLENLNEQDTPKLLALTADPQHIMLMGQ